MMFQVENNPEGYVVSCYRESHWQPLRNFGERQGDARCFMLFDCPKLTDSEIGILARRYDKDRVYERVSSRQFKTKKGDQR